MGNCLSCGHEFERHLFGGMCFYCDCKRAVFDTETPVYLRRHDVEERNKNGSSPESTPKTPRLGNK